MARRRNFDSYGLPFELTAPQTTTPTRTPRFHSKRFPGCRSNRTTDRIRGRKPAMDVPYGYSASYERHMSAAR